MKNHHKLLILFFVFVFPLAFRTTLVAQGHPLTTLPLGIPPISQEAALAAAANQISPSVLDKGRFESITYYVTGGYYTVTFVFSSTVTQKELGWIVEAGTELENTGALPHGTFRVLYFRVDGQTGDVILRIASDIELPPYRIGFDTPLNNHRLIYIAVAVIGIGALGWLVFSLRNRPKNLES